LLFLFQIGFNFHIRNIIFFFAYEIKRFVSTGNSLSVKITILSFPGLILALNIIREHLGYDEALHYFIIYA